jgi:2-dehydro-3-deoxyphosphogluconate aldolase/(4S)-4-hydroxy-2-oxoglutarate aldolase
MNQEIADHLSQAKVVPVIAINEAEEALHICEALQEGGLHVAEITFRTPAGQKGLARAVDAFPDFLIGAGTVTQIEEVDLAKDAGAKFAVAPGLNRTILSRAALRQLPFFPGVCTPSDIEAGLEEEITFLKFFPAEAAGGLKMLSAMYGPYAHRGVKFMPTGGISLSNLKDYLSHPAVAAIGGTWLVAKTLIEKKDWAGITQFTREAVDIAQSTGH